MKPEPTTAQSTLPIRLLTEADLPAAIPLLEQFYTLEHPGAPFSPDRALASWQALIRSGNAVLLGAFVDQRLVGLMGLAKRGDYYSGRTIVSEMAWYVDEADRGAVGLRLLHAAEWWAHNVGADDLIFGAFMNETGKLLGSVYERKGFHPFGIGYRKELTPCVNQSTQWTSWRT